ncbi:hypothetical protein COHA_009105 [Chlorella ohadii]|uniref:Uncharacterized protein n=1 Tax=Chlorella ohadii TaxID=2649997 RepID=A0AAD5DIM3_9CHLO|nr:hypothetical protein COHA_009105 [Chlorella ohadii]
MAEGSAFAMLAAPMMAAAENGRDPTTLISFFAEEMQQFFAHIQSAVRSYNASGELPQSLFKAKEGKGKRGAGKEKKERGKRKPSAFNLFVRDKLEEFKAKAFNLFVRDKLEEFKAKGVKAPEPREGEKQARNPLFSMAVAEWSKLSKEQKEAITKKYAAQLEEGAAHEDGGSAEEEEEEQGGSTEEEEEEEEESEEEEPAPKVEEHKKKKHKHHHHHH